VDIPLITQLNDSFDLEGTFLVKDYDTHIKELTTLIDGFFLYNKSSSANLTYVCVKNGHIVEKWKVYNKFMQYLQAESV